MFFVWKTDSLLWSLAVVLQHSEPYSKVERYCRDIHTLFFLSSNINVKCSSSVFNWWAGRYRNWREGKINRFKYFSLTWYYFYLISVYTMTMIWFQLIKLRIPLFLFSRSITASVMSTTLVYVVCMVLQHDVWTTLSSGKIHHLGIVMNLYRTAVMISASICQEYAGSNTNPYKKRWFSDSLLHQNKV